jgi:2-dehydro-3-deoxyphosphogluconate aldolase/(4S)-4-hydroxy-2-oxoglutarate aldolase
MKINETLKRLTDTGLIATEICSSNAKAHAKALIEGGIDTIEVRSKDFNTIIYTLKEAYPEVIVGAGDMRSVNDCHSALSAGADYITTCGMDSEIARICTKAEILYIPTCTTAGEIYNAVAKELKLVKLFPVELLGGPAFIKQITERFPDTKWILEGTFPSDVISHYACLKHVAGLVMCDLCSAKDIKAAAEAAVQKWMGFELYHLGINMPSANASHSLADKFNHAFGFDFAEGPFAWYSSHTLEYVKDDLFNFKLDYVPGDFYQTADFEIMKTLARGKNGHIGIRTNDVSRAIVYLKKRGYKMDDSTTYYADGRIFTIYFDDNTIFGDYAVHLLQKF